ncbi:TM2 domain-containing protein [Tenacibaculum piscium]|uniref:TM2 domain-containing protein n=1 Tax=Tenacibaculum piscium TaxID=1458515 RepID=A0A2H1YI87_9FLAO|nr:TM2 domain-containing protein [Tenacibaculum piscium]MBE7629778.1 NINE protein [Tenacibaculum piscium]MBE7670190.1 NINE protein [Tenacibaculum piscium]MBE7686347.1 NINE protein [Tenacibaculum piscium]MBE7691074.1 NINE protein [Tenacibaculum piscium]MCG8183931.1 TM2 domain-containing protein [Tenacibaculum piscium]
MSLIDENKLTVQNQESKRVLGGVLAILIGPLGIHKFALGYTKEGLIMLLGSVLTCGLAAPIFAIISLVEGITYLTKSDEEFINMYQVNKKGWF